MVNFSGNAPYSISNSTKSTWPRRNASSKARRRSFLYEIQNILARINTNLLPIWISFDRWEYVFEHNLIFARPLQVSIQRLDYAFLRRILRLDGSKKNRCFSFENSEYEPLKSASRIASSRFPWCRSLSNLKIVINCFRWRITWHNWTLIWSIQGLLFTRCRSNLYEKCRRGLK
jgi:hypothetical protein